MFLGPAAVGKTSLRLGLMNEPLPDKANSTVLAHTRPVKYSWVKSGGHSCHMAEVSEGDEISENLKLFHKYRTSLTRHSSESVSDESDSVSDEGDSVSGESGRRVVHSEVTAHENIIMDQLMCSDNKTEDNEVLLCLWDCGGQPVFLDLLPAFLSSRTVFLLMFDASKSLDDPFQVIINIEGQQRKEEVLEISIISLIQKWMASIHARFGMINRSGQLPAYPRIIIVGTHADQLAPGQPLQAKKKVIEQVFSKISAAVDKNEYADMILGRLMVDNTLAGQSDQTGSGFEELHQLITTFVEEKLTTETPISWIHFRKVLQLYTRKKKPVISLEEVYSIAEDCRMPRGDVPSALKFYHELGVFLFYVDIESLKSVVFLEPQWLVDRFGELLARWKEKPEHRNMWITLTQLGILVEPLYEAVLRNVQEFCLTPSSLVDMLEHFLLAAPIVTNGIHPKSGRVKEYFVPLMLQHHLSQSTLSSSQPSSAVKSAAPIHLTFLSGYVPPGYFVRLTTSLASKEEINVLFHYGIYRNQITMDIGVDRLIITEHNNTIEIHFSRQAPFREPFRESCQRVLNILKVCLDEVSLWLPGANVKLAFLCSECKAITQTDADTSWRAKACLFSDDQLETEYLHCQMGHHSLPTDSEKCWLQPHDKPTNTAELPQAAAAVADVQTVTTIDQQSLSQATCYVTATEVQVAESTCKSSSLSSRPTMNNLISMKRRDGSVKKLRIIKQITAHKSTKCVDFGYLLLNDDLEMKELRKKHKDDDGNDELIRAVLEIWLNRDDDEEEGSLPCTWESLVQCAEDADLDGVFVKLLRDNVL